jgi:branched-chain amino acid transport system permease protein
VSPGPDFIERLLQISWDATWQGLSAHYAEVTWAFLLDILVDYGVYLVSALGLFVLFVAGQYSLGHAGLVGIGAYATAVLVVKLGVPFWLSLPLSGIAGMLAGFTYCFLLGFRLSGFYLAIGTFAFAEALITFWLSSDFFGGALGFPKIPLRSNWLNTAIVVAVVLFLVWRLERSRFWLAFQAVRESPIVAGAMGVDVRRTKLLAWGIGGFLTGIGGNLFAHRVTILTPIDFGVAMTLVLLLGVLLGGLRTFWGTVAGGAFVYFMPWLTTTDEPRARLMLYGIIIVVLMVFRPGGLLPAGAPRARSAEDLKRLAQAVDGKASIAADGPTGRK